MSLSLLNCLARYRSNFIRIASPTCRLISTMRFTQFSRGDCHSKHLGILSEDGQSIVEISNKSIPNDMITFIDQFNKLEELKLDLKNEDYERISNVRLLPPVTNPEKIICVGLNYLDHCLEQNKEKPTEPMFFSKFSTSLVSATDNVIAHKIARRIDWEVELAVIIGKKAHLVSQSNAMDYVFGYTIAQDVSSRDWQKRNGGQYLIGKSMDTFCPLGPAIVHKSIIKDPHNLNLKTFINGVEKQNGNTRDMIFKIDELVSALSQSITLKPGDVILTGTPKGVGVFRNPREFLKPGDVIDTEIECLGKMRNHIVAPQM